MLQATLARSRERLVLVPVVNAVLLLLSLSPFYYVLLIPRFTCCAQKSCIPYYRTHTVPHFCIGIRQPQMGRDTIKSQAIYINR